MNEGSETPPTGPKKVDRRGLLTLLPKALSRLKESPSLKDRLEQKWWALLQTKMDRREFVKWFALYSSTSNLIIRAIIELAWEELLAPRVAPFQPTEVSLIPQENRQAKVEVVDEEGNRRILEQANVSFRPPAGVRFFRHTLGELIGRNIPDQFAPDAVFICVMDRDINSYPVLVAEEDLPSDRIPFFYPVKRQDVHHIKDLTGITQWAEAQAVNHKLFVYNAGGTNKLLRQIREIVLGDRPKIPTPGLVNLN